MLLASWGCVFEVKVRLLPKIVESRDRHMLSAKKRSLMPRHFVPFGYFPDSSHCGRGVCGGTSGRWRRVPVPRGSLQEMSSRTTVEHFCVISLSSVSRIIPPTATALSLFAFFHHCKAAAKTRYLSQFRKIFSQEEFFLLLCFCEISYTGK